MIIYDIEIVHDRDLLIFGSDQQLHFFNFTKRTKKKTIQLDVVYCIHSIIVDGEYLYMTCGNSLRKYNLNSLLEDSGENALIWKSSQSILSNCWGLALHQFMNNNNDEGLKVFDSISGQQVEIKIPKIKTCFGIAFTDENEMIISSYDSSNGPIQIYTFNGNCWQKIREAKRNSLTFETPYGICYERKSKLIYIADTYGDKISVMNKETMEVVKEWKTHGNRVYGMSIDSKNGHLYLPCLASESIQIMK